MAYTGNKSSQFNQSITDYQNKLNQFQSRVGGQANSNLAGINNQLGWYNQAVGETSNPNEVAKSSDQASSTMDQYQKSLAGLFANPGYSPDEQRGMRLATTTPMATAYGTAQYHNGAAAAMNGNEGAAMANNNALARSKARDMSTGLSGLQGRFADARIAGQQTAFGASQLPVSYAQGRLQGQQNNTSLFQFPATLQAQMYGQNLGAEQNGLSQEGNVANMYMSRASQPGFFKQAALAGIQGSVGAATGKILK